MLGLLLCFAWFVTMFKHSLSCFSISSFNIEVSMRYLHRTVFLVRMLDFGQFDFGQFDFGQGRRGSHTTARELQTRTFERPALQTPPKFHERTPRERKKKENCGGKWGLPTLRAPHPFGPPTFGAPTFSGFGPPPSGPPPFVCPPFWVPPFWAPHPSGLHFFLWATLRGPTLCRPKIQHPKIGRNRNWPKSKLAEVEIGQSKLAEVEIGRTRKKKLAEVDRALFGTPTCCSNFHSLANFCWYVITSNCSFQENVLPGRSVYIFFFDTQN